MNVLKLMRQLAPQTGWYSQNSRVILEEATFGVEEEEPPPEPGTGQSCYYFIL